MSQLRYYLVRREGREFIGPMFLDEFKQRLDRLEFGMQDEISGHCGPWIVMDHKEDMLRYYPDVAKVFGENLPLSWRETTGHAKVISRRDARKERKNEFEEQKKSRTDFYRYMELRRRQSNFRARMAVFTIVVSILVGAWIVSRRDEGPNLSEITPLAQKADPTDFLNAMGLKVVPQASRLAKSPKLQPIWLPYLRMYAYYTTGAIDGVSQKMLKGDAPAYAPIECSVDFWKKKWRENQGINLSFIQSAALQKTPWTKLLAIDPDWLRRRNYKLWIKPKSYLEGCLMTAHTAIRSLAQEPLGNTDGVEPPAGEALSAITSRLKFQLDVVTMGRVPTPTTLNGILGQLICFETQMSLNDLEKCRQNMDPQFKPLLEERYSLAILRLVLAQEQSILDKKWQAVLQSVLPKFVAEDFMSRFDLTPEMKLMSYINSYGDINQAVSRVKEEYPDIEFR